MNINKIVERSKAASKKFSSLSSIEKNKILIDLAQALEENPEEIIRANKKDMKLGKN